LIQVTAFAIFTATWIIMGFVGTNSMMQQTIDPYLFFQTEFYDTLDLS
jgi:hypothetical protein